jgi:hypothetical protein
MIFDDLNMFQVASLNRHCKEEMGIDTVAAGDKCSAVLDYLNTVSGGIFPYDSRIFGYDWAATEQATDDYFDSTKNPDWAAFIAAIHVDAST